jgi:hypothetical protein
MDKRKNNGGHATNGGRKSKAEELQLIEKLSPLEPLAFKALTDAITEGKDWAVKLFFQDNYGMPKQVVDQNTNLTVDNFSIKDVISFDNSKSKV